MWRYATPRYYIQLIVADAIACVAFVLLRRFLPHKITFVRAVALFMMNLLGCITIRLFYQLAYQKRTSTSNIEKIALLLIHYLTGTSFKDETVERNRIKVAIVGAGSVGAMLADELLLNPKATYEPVCFVDIDKGKELSINYPEIFMQAKAIAIA
jgi:FlaA1/EpsC-like NDP-sugar epimerase